MGCPVVLLRNLTLGLANGTRLIICGLQDRLQPLEVEVIAGPLKGTRTLIPRLSITPSDVEMWPFTLCRRQFPVRPHAFGMTINKSQGPTFSKVGLYIPNDVFTHCQLYVGLSRVGSPDGLTVLVPSGHLDGGAVFTRNVVHSQVLLLQI